MTRMRSLSRAILAGGLGLAVSLIVSACGGGSGLLSADQSNSINGQLSQISSALQSGDCTTVSKTTIGLARSVAELPPSVNPTLRQNLDQGISTVGKLANQQCKQRPSTRTTPTTPTSASTSASTSTTQSTPAQTTTTTRVAPTTTATSTSTPAPATTTSSSGTTSTGSGGAPIGGGNGGGNPRGGGGATPGPAGAVAPGAAGGANADKGNGGNGR